MPQRHMQDMVRHKADLFGQAKKVKSRPVADDLALRYRWARSVAVTTPERQDGKCGIDLSQMGNGLRGASRMWLHGRPIARRSAA
jgi:hypothetical protein